MLDCTTFRLWGYYSRAKTSPLQAPLIWSVVESCAMNIASVISTRTSWVMSVYDVSLFTYQNCFCVSVCSIEARSSHQGQGSCSIILAFCLRSSESKASNREVHGVIWGRLTQLQASIRSLLWEWERDKNGKFAQADPLVLLPATVTALAIFDTHM